MRIGDAVERAGVMFAVCHVLRYTPYTRLVKRLLRRRRGSATSSASQHLEPVGFWHQAHSYVRGNWRREDGPASMLLAKCCHDLDWLATSSAGPATAVVLVRRPRPLPARGAARRRRRPLPGLRGRAGLPVLGAPALPRGWPSAARTAGRVERARRPPTPAGVERGAARRARTAAACTRATTTWSTTRSCAGVRGRRDGDVHDDRVHAACATAGRGSSAPAASWRRRVGGDVHDFHSGRDDRHAGARADVAAGHGGGDAGVMDAFVAAAAAGDPALVATSRPRRSSRTGSRSPPRRRAARAGSSRWGDGPDRHRDAAVGDPQAVEESRRRAGGGVTCSFPLRVQASHPPWG